jgi:hypothetical protein
MPAERERLTASRAPFALSDARRVQSVYTDLLVRCVAHQRGHAQGAGHLRAFALKVSHGFWVMKSPAVSSFFLPVSIMSNIFC